MAEARQCAETSSKAVECSRVQESTPGADRDLASFGQIFNRPRVLPRRCRPPGLLLLRASRTLRILPMVARTRSVPSRRLGSGSRNARQLSAPLFAAEPSAARSAARVHPTETAAERRRRDHCRDGDRLDAGEPARARRRDRERWWHGRLSATAWA